jgi:hypothetical protein
MLLKLATNSIRTVLAPATPNDLCCKQSAFVFSRRVEPDSNFAAWYQWSVNGELGPEHRNIHYAQRNIAADALFVSDTDCLGGTTRLPARGNAAIAS